MMNGRLWVVLSVIEDSWLQSSRSVFYVNLIHVNMEIFISSELHLNLLFQIEDNL